MTGLLYDLPELGVAALFAAMIVLAAWLVWKALPYYRCIVALRTAAPANAGTGAAGLVKVTGAAHPAEVPEGYAAPKMVWREQSRYDGLSGRTSGTRSVARIAVRDGTGEFLIHAEEAIVVPGGRETEEQRRIFGDSTVTTVRFIRTGGQVIAAGMLGDKRVKPGRDETKRRLRRSPQGVLLLSGRDEARTLRWLQWRAVPAGVAAGACLAVAGWIWWVRPLF